MMNEIKRKAEEITQKFVKEKCRYYTICNAYQKDAVTCNKQQEANGYCGIYRIITRLFTHDESVYREELMRK